MTGIRIVGGIVQSEGHKESHDTLKSILTPVLIWMGETNQGITEDQILDLIRRGHTEEIHRIHQCIHQVVREQVRVIIGVKVGSHGML